MINLQLFFINNEIKTTASLALLVHYLRCRSETVYIYREKIAISDTGVLAICTHRDRNLLEFCLR